MDDRRQERGDYVSVVGGFMAGLLMGGLVGGGAMLLLAPNSGKETRAKIRQEGLELHRRVTDAAEGAVAQARGKARRLTADARKQAEELQQRGQEFIDWRRERLSTAIEAGKTAVHTLTAGDGQARSKEVP